ncbi:MAG: hypothetical protein IPJ81_03850 [Chitinophagaceae bacterium]|nr:hypothetical protein [Chitinophagaceae bacterium]
MVQEKPDPRLEEILNRINDLQIRFPVAEIVKKTGLNKGNVSAMLAGKKTLSDNFYNAFMQKFPSKDEDAPIVKRIADLQTQLGIYEKRLMDAESVNGVLKTAIEKLTVLVTGKKESLVSSELDEAILMTSKAKMGRLRRRVK